MSKLKLNNNRKTKIIELNDNFGSYICEYGHLHDYSKINLNEFKQDTQEKYNNITELIQALEKE